MRSCRYQLSKELRIRRPAYAPVQLGKGYRQVINVILHHSSNLELSKKSCIILKQLLKECTDSQLPSRMVEGHCAEALQLMIETPPEKDDETKELVLEILNYLFLVKGVLHKIVAKHGKGILKMFMNTDKPKMAQAVIECLQNTASEGLEELENEALAKMNLLVKSHQNDMAVCVSGSEYIKSLFENSDFERIKQCGITSRDIIISFGPYNMDDKIFRNLDVAIDKMGTDEEFYSVLDELLRSPKSDDFWIMSHLVDRPSLDIEGKKEQINSIIKLCDTKDLVKSLNSEVCFFLKELHRSRPELSKTLMKEKSLLIKKVMDEIDCIKGPYKFIGLQVLQQNLEDHSKFMRDNDIIQKSEKWMRECESPEDMRQILSFLESFCDDKELKKDMMAANLHKLAIQKCQNEFKGKPETFSALYSYLSKCIPGDDAINDFCESGYMGRTFDMAASMVDEIKDLEKFMDFTTKVVGTPKAAAKLTGSFDSMTKLFCTLFEKRIIDFFNKWYTDRNKKEVWATNYRPEFLDIISTEKERDALRKAFSGYDLSKIETPIHASAIGDKGIDVLAQLSQNMATFVCFLAKDDPDTLNTLNYRVLIGDSVQSLKNNIEFLTEKTLKLHVVPRYMAMFCMLLPLFKQKPYVKKVSSKKSEFCYLEFIQFIELAAPRHPILAYYTLASYGLYTIPRNLKPEKTIAATEGDAEDTKGAAAYEDSVWTPLTIILNDNPVSSSIVDSLAKTLKRVGEPIQNFVGYLSLTMSFLYGTQDGDIILSSQLVGSIISSVNDETLDPQLAISAIYSMDCWCETSEKAIITLNNLGSYDKLLRYMNNLRGQDILKLVISSLLQKLANYTDGAQLEYDLERLVKKCKDYDEFRATKGDELREDALSAYNELSGLLQIKKAQQYCLNKNLQNVTLNTLAFELRRDPEEMLSKGLIVNYQDLLNQLLSANSSLYENAKSKPDDHKNMTSVLQNVLKKWRNDPVITRNTLELTKAVIRKKGQLELNAQQTKELHTDLLALQSLYKNDPEIIALSNDVINLLDFQSIKEVVEPEPAIHIPDAPVSEEQVEEAEVYIAPQVDTIAEEEQNAKDLQEGFITEEVFASVQEAVNFIREEAAAEQKQEEATLFDSDFNDTTTGPETPQSETDDLNMRDENDRNRAFNALCKKVENPADNSQDELITKAQKKLDEIEIDELALAIYYAKWIAKSTSKPETTPQVGNPSLKLRANLEKFAGHVELLKYTCSATAAAGKASPELVQTIMESDLITVERQYIVTQHKPDPSTLNYFSKTVKHCANTEENKIAISQKGVIRVFTNALNPLKHESETVLASVLQAVNAINSSKQSCPINMDVSQQIYLRKLSLSRDSLTLELK